MIPKTLNPYATVKAGLGFFLCIFSSVTCLKKPVFSKPVLLRLKVRARLYCEKIPALLYVGKGPTVNKAFSEFRPVPEAALIFVVYFCR
jgi:hypothetical protein